MKTELLDDINIIVNETLCVKNFSYPKSPNKFTNQRTRGLQQEIEIYFP